MRAKNKPYLLGLTGGVGCGKTTCAQMLCALGAQVVDADMISRALTAPGGPLLPAIRERFGDAVFAPDGALNRHALAERVFGNPENKRALEAITHPAIQREMLQQIDACEKSVAVLDVPLLFETGIDAMCDETWVVSCDRETQILRVMSRDSMTRSEAARRIDSQMPLTEKERRADRVIRTGRPIDDVRAEITRLYQALVRKHV